MLFTDRRNPLWMRTIASLSALDVESSTTDEVRDLLQSELT